MTQIDPYSLTSGHASVRRAVLQTRLAQDRSWKPTQIAGAEQITEEEFDRCLRMNAVVARLLAA